MDIQAKTSPTPPVAGKKRIPRQILPSPLKGKIADAVIRDVIRGIHIVPRGQGWEVLPPPSQRIARRRFRSRDAACKFARDLRHDRKAKIFLHHAGGRVEILAAA